MKIVHIVPGSGGTFYCQNCLRDNQLITALRSLGLQVIMVPMYLPLNVDVHGLMGDTPVFFGAVNTYLKEKLPIYRRAPLWVERALDSPALLQLIAKRAGATRAAGLEEMTLSMLRGEEGRQASELDHLVRYLKEHVQPEIVHLSNALLLGLARRLKYDLGAAVVCSLQDEHEWIDPMRPEYRDKVWQLMAERAVDVDAFISTGRHYLERVGPLLNLPKKKTFAVDGGIDASEYEPSPLPLDPPVIGYLCRMNEYFGLGVVVDAFLRLKQESRFKSVRLKLTGGYTGDDRPFVKRMLRRIEKAGWDRDVEIVERFDRENRILFLKSLTLLSVPVLNGEAFGAYQIEALAAGVPIVQPNVGGYPEFIERTGGGIIYEPNDGEHLAAAWASLLDDPTRLRAMAEQGRKAALEQFSMQKMAESILKVYRRLRP
ncbi:MAG: glycosyltransferase family 4 protein [candidate division KSB1 bacterium]|nr:glycosyltransferase family 4 protein [candidate division KSB1 bacterium]